MTGWQNERKPIMKATELMEQWYAGIKLQVLSHYECAKLYESYHRRLGYPTVILSALTGTAFVASLNDSDIWWIKGVAVVLSLMVTVLASLQTFLRYSERAEKHKTAAEEFGKLRRELEEMLVLVPAGGDIAKNDMDAIRTTWGDLSTNAPAIPNHILTRIKNQSAKARAVSAKPALAVAAVAAQ
jgi:hypothetical protein